MALSRAETLLVSSSGDLLTCRDKAGPYPSGEPTDAWAGYQWQEDLALLCCGAEVDDLSAATARARENGASVIAENVAGPAGDASSIRDPGGSPIALWKRGS